MGETPVRVDGFGRKFACSTDPDAYQYDRRRVRARGNSPSIKTLQARHRKIIQYHVEGWSNVDIAEVMGITAQMVSITLNSECTKAAIEVEVERSTPQRKIQAALDDALDLLTTSVKKGELTVDTAEKVDGKEQSVTVRQVVPASQRISAAKELLDRAPNTARVRRNIEEQGPGIVDQSAVDALRVRFAAVMEERTRGDLEEGEAQLQLPGTSVFEEEA